MNEELIPYPMPDIPNARNVFPRKVSGVSLIAAERRRQVEQEGWTPEHDASHHEGELARAAACYALAASAPFFANRIERGLWPQQWDFKRADSVRMLAKAGALIAAEIDRLAAPASPGIPAGPQ